MNVAGHLHRFESATASSGELNGSSMERVNSVPGSHLFVVFV